MNLKRIFMLFIVFLGSIFLFACNCGKEEQGEENQPDKVEPVIINNDYYSEDNFIESTKTVNKTTLITYDGPEYLTESTKCKVKVEGVSLFVYETRVNHDRQFSWMMPTDMAPVVIFDFEGKVHVEIEVNEEVTTAVVRPQLYGISPSISGKVISFDLSYSGNYVVEYNDNSDNVIHVFANPIETDPITKEMADNDDSIIYIGPGVYKADAIPVKDNVTIYIAGGAYVYGQIRAENMHNVTVRGRGIISGYLYNRRSESEYTIPIEMRYCDNVKIEGITFLDPAGWTVALYKSQNIEINNIKIITARQNGDGISVQSCDNVKVTGGFVRSWDDSLVVKCVDGGNTNHVEFDGVVVWTDLAQSMEVGYEASGEIMDDVTFKNIIVVHNFHKAVISMHNADDCQISNVRYQNITVEDCQTLGDNRNDEINDFLIDLCVLYNQDWSKSTNIKGTVRNVTISNVRVYKILDSIISRINGYSATANISGVTIQNLEIAGRIINSESDLKLVKNDYASSISVSSDKVANGASVTLPYKLNLTSSEVTKQAKSNVMQTGMLVPEFARSKGDIPYIGVAASGTYTASATHSAGNKTTTPSDDGSGDFSMSGTNPNNVVDNDSSTTWKNAAWKGEENEFAALTIEFGKRLNVGVVRLIGNVDNNFYYTYSLQVWGKKVNKDGEVNDKYIRLIGLKDYEMTPGSSNIIDINITTQEYAGIQLRFYKGNYDSSPAYYEISAVEFYAPSLSYNKAIVYSTPHNDVYNVEKLVDGDPTGTSYYESKELPATVIIDLGDVYDISVIVLSLPPSLKWDARSEEIEISYSASSVAYSDASTQFTTLVEKTKYLFDPQTGNRNIIIVPTTSARFIKLVITSNDIKAGYNAQLSEINVYGE